MTACFVMKMPKVVLYIIYEITVALVQAFC
jgi:hypothetical protein